MLISLYSHRDQLRDLGRLERTSPNEADIKYPLVAIIRENGNENIRYSIPPEVTIPPRLEWRTIVLKGKDTAAAKTK